MDRSAEERKDVAATGVQNSENDEAALRDDQYVPKNILLDEKHA